MKKNANILDYVEKYKYKYGISFIEDGGKAVKRLGAIVWFAWVYSYFFLLLSIYGAWDARRHGVTPYHNDIIVETIVLTVLMLVGAVLYKFKKKIIALATYIIVQLTLIFMYRPLNLQGLSYRPRYYLAYFIPGLVIIFFSAILLILIIRGIVKNNRIYAMLEEGLYKQYGTRDGEKLTGSEWNEFLTNFNPHRQVVKDNSHKQ